MGAVMDEATRDQLEKVIRQGIEISQRMGKSFEQLLITLKRIEEEKKAPKK
jgi:hypothetical protein